MVKTVTIDERIFRDLLTAANAVLDFAGKSEKNAAKVKLDGFALANIECSVEEAERLFPRE